MCDQTAQRHFLPNEIATTGPRDEIDVDIRLDNPGHRPRTAPRCRSRYPRETTTAEKRQETIIEAVPRGNQNRERADPKKLVLPRSSCGQVEGHLGGRALRREFALFCHDRVVRMLPAVLKNINPGSQR